jgi:hypothetical protein
MAKGHFGFLLALRSRTPGPPPFSSVKSTPDLGLARVPMDLVNTRRAAAGRLGVGARGKLRPFSSQEGRFKRRLAAASAGTQAAETAARAAISTWPGRSVLSGSLG